MPTYKEQQILDKVCKLTRQKQINYYDFIPFFDFQYEKLIFNCQPSHFSPCSAAPVVGVTKTQTSKTQRSISFKRDSLHSLQFDLMFFERLINKIFSYLFAKEN